MSIIIVGNGTSIKDNQDGKKIDGFDTVLRFNSFKIKGYEQYTGTKTDIWFTVNIHHIKNINTFKEVLFHSWTWNESKCKVYQSILKSRPDCKKITKEFVGKIYPSVGTAPSTGLIAIYKMLERYDDVVITGFDWWERNEHHYGDNEVRGHIHNPKKEHEVIQKLIKQNRVKFLNG